MSAADRTGPTVLVVSNRKGGTGKTTTAVNLAAEFAAAGRRTLLIDLDTQGHCALGLGVTPSPDRPTVHHLFQDNGIGLLDTRYPTCCLGLDLAPANPDFQHGSAPDDEQVLAQALADPALTSRYDQVVIDSPPSLDHLLLNALAAAHWAVIPFMPHPLAGEGVRQLSKVFFKVAMRSNANLRLMGVLPVMLDMRIRQHQTVRDQVARQFGEDRVLGGIRNDIKLAESFAAGRPIRLYAPRSRGNEDYKTVFGLIEQRMRA
ncbi:ParA family protein [Ectothiorhodospira lacustris]|uniref:ParA family protein n=1 Tax=Ectothiorhodospira lacustris TaxID=2899127 RepID=UPI001EE99FEC|nr:ParA family protein [Ectothiorhodospira lacustris]MCG5500983.1 ParA family protein [Ectothiorhodospira lacustris]MCG5510017.1 ParA family protein [Ectothiorhodospira lacustris]MCG5521763.1 ParA family protein [Ectothiorhodospira lacustris]